jgi:hypothetical protein
MNLSVCCYSQPNESAPAKSLILRRRDHLGPSGTLLNCGGGESTCAASVILTPAVSAGAVASRSLTRQRGGSGSAYPLLAAARS